jgi:Flp pilus assembly protein CpaB
MRRGRIFIYLALIFILLLAGGYLVYQRVYLPSQAKPTPGAGEIQPTPEPVVETVDVVVLTQPLVRGALITEDVIKMVPYAKDVFIVTMFTDMGQVINRQAKFDLDSGIVLTGGMIADSVEQLSETGSVAALSIPPGYVAVSIPISRLSSVSYAPRAGDHVSVIMTLMYIDLDTEFQTELPNVLAGVLAPGPVALLGNMAVDESGTTQTDIQGETQQDQQTLNLWGQEGDPTVTNLVVQVAYGGQLSKRGRTEIDPILNELMYLVPSETQRPRIFSQTFLPDVLVLGVGNFLLPEQEQLLREEAAQKKAAEEAQAQQAAQPQQQQQAAETPAAEEPAKEIVFPDVITIVVRPQEAVTLNYLIYSGAELTLALRPAGDTSVVATEAATLQFLIDEYNVPSPAKLPYGIEPRIDALVPPVLENDKPVETP